jgi:hypothetical protein
MLRPQKIMSAENIRPLHNRLPRLILSFLKNIFTPRAKETNWKIYRVFKKLPMMVGFVFPLSYISKKLYGKPSRHGCTYVVDPHGKIMMVFEGQPHDPKTGQTSKLPTSPGCLFSIVANLLGYRVKNGPRLRAVVLSTSDAARSISKHDRHNSELLASGPEEEMIRHAERDSRSAIAINTADFPYEVPRSSPKRTIQGRTSNSVMRVFSRDKPEERSIDWADMPFTAPGFSTDLHDEIPSLSGIEIDRTSPIEVVIARFQNQLQALGTPAELWPALRSETTASNKRSVLRAMQIFSQRPRSTASNPFDAGMAPA